MSKNIKVLILSCGTGGGHNSAALAVKENLNERGIKADFVEYLEIINNKLKDGINKLYIKTTKRKGKIFKHVYKLGELYRKTNLRSPVYGLNSLNKRKLYAYIKENGYTYIVTTHLFAAQALTAIKKEHNIKFIAIATDYTCIPFWEETNPDFLIIPNKDLIKDFTKRGIEEAKLLPYGIPVAKAYKMQEEKDIAKTNLKLAKDKKYILILTGSMGFGNTIEMIKKLEKEIEDVIFIISCGNNKKMLENIKKEHKNTDRVIALPFTNNLSEYMAACEIVLTKPRRTYIN